MTQYAERVTTLLLAIKDRDPELYKALRDACEFVLDHPLRAHAASAALQVSAADAKGVVRGRGMVMRLPVVGYPPWKVFWTTIGPRIEAVFEYES